MLPLLMALHSMVAAWPFSMSWNRHLVWYCMSKVMAWAAPIIASARAAATMDHEVERRARATPGTPTPRPSIASLAAPSPPPPFTSDGPPSASSPDVSRSPPMPMPSQPSRFRLSNPTLPLDVLKRSRRASPEISGLGQLSQIFPRFSLFQSSSSFARDRGDSETASRRSARRTRGAGGRHDGRHHERRCSGVQAQLLEEAQLGHLERAYAATTGGRVRETASTVSLLAAGKPGRGTA